MPKKKNSPPDPEQIANYLREQPEFFEHHQELLAELQLPHPGGHAVSLVERQLQTLRQRNGELQRQLEQLTATARANEALFGKTRRLTLDLLAAGDLPQLLGLMKQSLERDFEVDVSALTLIGGTDAPGARVVSLQEARCAINGILSSSGAVCGTLRPGELAFLFEQEATRIGSAAVAPLTGDGLLGVLALGSYDPDRYRASMGTVFLRHVGEVLNAVLPRLLPHPA